MPFPRPLPPKETISPPAPPRGMGPGKRTKLLLWRLPRKEFQIIAMKKFNTRQLALDAMLAAMCAVLANLALDFTQVKITFESVPVLIAALLFGPLDGMAVGFVGTTIYQLLRHGVTVTTPLWILPYVLCGLIVGVCAKRKKFSLSQAQMIGIVAAAELVVTGVNTGALYIDSNLFGYYFPGFITGALALRLVICVAKAVAYAMLLPLLLPQLRKITRGRGGAAA